MPHYTDRMIGKREHRALVAAQPTCHLCGWPTTGFADGRPLCCAHLTQATVTPPPGSHVFADYAREQGRTVGEGCTE
jgi:hypothetical protein